MSSVVSMVLALALFNIIVKGTLLIDYLFLPSSMTFLHPEKNHCQLSCRSEEYFVPPLNKLIEPFTNSFG